VTLSALLVSSLIIAALGILGSIYQGRKRAVGWALGFGSEVAWILSGIITHSWGLSIAGFAYAGVAAHNFLKWRREETAEPTAQPRRAKER
jgi:hypothetical protein